MRRSFWITAARLAVRNARGSALRSAYIAGAISLSIAAVSAISHSATVVRRTLAQGERTWLGGDVAVETSEPFSDAQIATFDRMRGEGIEWTMTTFVLTLASSSHAPDPAY